MHNWLQKSAGIKDKLQDATLVGLMGAGLAFGPSGCDSGSCPPQQQSQTSQSTALDAIANSVDRNPDGSYNVDIGLHYRVTPDHLAKIQAFYDERMKKMPQEQPMRHSVQTALVDRLRRYIAANCEPIQ